MHLSASPMKALATKIGILFRPFSFFLQPYQVRIHCWRIVPPASQFFQKFTPEGQTQAENVLGSSERVGKLIRLGKFNEKIDRK